MLEVDGMSGVTFRHSCDRPGLPGVGLAEGPRRVSMSDLDRLETRKWLDALNSVVVT
jgi:hypothetical protein